MLYELECRALVFGKDSKAGINFRYIEALRASNCDWAHAAGEKEKRIEILCNDLDKVNYNHHLTVTRNIQLEEALRVSTVALDRAENEVRCFHTEGANALCLLGFTSPKNVAALDTKIAELTASNTGMNLALAWWDEYYARTQREVLRLKEMLERSEEDLRQTKEDLRHAAAVATRKRALVAEAAIDVLRSANLLEQTL